jgi:RNA ligase
MNESAKTIKPLGGKCYGHICHLPGSRLGPGDHKLNEGESRILTERVRDRHDQIIVSEKLDGSNVGVARINGVLVPLIRAGYPAISSRFEQHRLFAAWVFEHSERFAWLGDGERVCGEWLAQAHGTRYDLRGLGPSHVFDIMRGDERAPFAELTARVGAAKPLAMVKTIHSGGPLSIASAMELLGAQGFCNALDPVEGAVWRVERRGVVDFLGKYVRPEKADGLYLPEISGKPAIWNWRPA